YGGCSPVASRSLPGFTARGRSPYSARGALPERLSQHDRLQPSATGGVQERAESHRRICRLERSTTTGGNGGRVGSLTWGHSAALSRMQLPIRTYQFNFK